MSLEARLRRLETRKGGQVALGDYLNWIKDGKPGDEFWESRPEADFEELGEFLDGLVEPSAVQVSNGDT